MVGDNITTVDFKTEQAKRNIDEHLLWEDEEGRTWFTFDLSYRDTDFDRTYSFNIMALDFDDAERRVKLIKKNLKLDGRVCGEIA